ITAGLALAAFAIIAGSADRLADLAFPLPCPTRSVLAELEVGNIQLGDGNADQFAALAADHLALRNVLPQVLTNLAAHNLLEAALVAFNLQTHDCLTAVSTGERVHSGQSRAPVAGRRAAGPCAADCR